MMEAPGSITVQPSCEVSSLLLRPEGARALLVLGHGAGAGMRHPFLEDLARRLAGRKLATFRYQFPYMERGHGRPDSPSLLLATVRAATAAASGAAPELPLFAGGKSMGGRITSMAAAEGTLAAARGLVFIGYPLHAPGKAEGKGARDRREHLSRIGVPMLFLQGTRDRLAEITRMRELCASLGERASLHVVAEADHSFHVPKRSGRTDEEAAEDLVSAVDAWIRRLGVP